jgi:hypothetical protein
MGKVLEQISDDEHVRPGADRVAATADQTHERGDVAAGIRGDDYFGVGRAFFSPSKWFASKRRTISLLVTPEFAAHVSRAFLMSGGIPTIRRCSLKVSGMG